MLDRASSGVRGEPRRTPNDLEDGISANGHGPSAVARQFLDGNGPGPEMFEVGELADAYVSLLRSSGVVAELRVHQGQMHGFFEPVEIRQGERAFQQVVRTLRSICSRSERLEGAAASPLDDLLAHA